MKMKLYEKLKEREVVTDVKEFAELVWLRALKVNDIFIDDPLHEIKDNDRIQIGVYSLDL